MKQPLHTKCSHPNWSSRSGQAYVDSLSNEKDAQIISRANDFDHNVKLVVMEQPQELH